MRWPFAMNYAHWMMVIGAALVVIGFIGYAFRKNRNEQEQDDRAKAKGK
jgi:LPXTG-motif cell wall-anchored protein